MNVGQEEVPLSPLALLSPRPSSSLSAEELERDEAGRKMGTHLSISTSPSPTTACTLLTMASGRYDRRLWGEEPKFIAAKGRNKACSDPPLALADACLWRRLGGYRLASHCSWT